MTEKSSEKESVGGTEGGSAWLEVFEVLYSPIKAFKKIVEKAKEYLKYGNVNIYTSQKLSELESF